MWEIEKMLQMDGLKYISTPRPAKNRGGGVALIVDLEKYSCEKMSIFIPKGLEVVWGLLKPKSSTAQVKKIIACSFYSPPNNGRNTRLADYLVGALQMLSTKYPDAGIIMGADKNKMDISPILNCGLRLRQEVNENTRQGSILDILIMNLSRFYNSPIIAPPLNPDDPTKAKPSDHSVPIAIPHTDRHNPPSRNYTFHTVRPLPLSGLNKFSQWISAEEWGGIRDVKLSSTEQAAQFEKMLQENLNLHCPQKTVKLGSQDKPFINSELKKIHRLKSREYIRNGKSEKYKSLLKQFQSKYKAAAQKYLRKNTEALKESNPGQAYRILKKLGAQPGDCTDDNTFSLPAHLAANLTNQESAERIAEHFSAISQEYAPLDQNRLPTRVKTKLNNCGAAPLVTTQDTLKKIQSAKKPRSGVPGDLPCQITKEFSVEISAPLSYILNNIFQSATWPEQWKMEYVTPIGKIAMPETEDDIRPISLTNFFSKVAEHFIVTWLLEYIGEKIDIRQFGGSKGNSITHYIIELVNFILSNQEDTAPTAILACLVDFSKAFNRQDHKVLNTKLSDMNVPGWLLKLVIAFLTNRKMVVRYKGATSSSKDLPGGGPQGTLLGLLLFLVLINDAGFQDQENEVGVNITSSRKNFKATNLLHLKYIDDMTLAESIKLKEKLVDVPVEDRTLPAPFHARTGHALPQKDSAVFKQLDETKKYADTNGMKLNYKKTKMMLFNNCKNWDFLPEFEVEGIELQLVEEMKILGVVLRADMKWSSNTKFIIQKAYSKLWMLRRLKKHGAATDDLLDVYMKQVRSVLELTVPAWHSGLTQSESLDIERVQKAALHIVLGANYSDYNSALKTAQLDNLATRREQLCLNFGKKAAKSSKHGNWFKINENKRVTRQPKPKFCPVFARTKRFENSPISYLTGLLNKYYKK